MHYIQVPSDIAITVKGVEKPIPFTFSEFATSAWLDDPRAIQGGFAKHVRWAKVFDLFAGRRPGEVIALEDEDHKTLRAIVEAPGQMNLPPSVLVKLIPFSRAVLEASDTLAVPPTAEV